MNNKEETKYFVALSQEPKIGARTLLKLVRRFRRLADVWGADYADFKKKQIPENIIQLIISLRKKVDPEKEMEKIKKLGISVVTISDKHYPRLLKEIPDPPALLYIKGEIRPEDELAVAVVGSRKYTSYGARVCEFIASELAAAGLTIVSGLALGIDTFAHKVTLSLNNGRTIGVLACGLDQIYPHPNQDLARRIIDGHGAIISEFPLGTPALPHHFPIRNRIIAGLSLGVLVVEASLESGSFLTARSALEYNREVFAVPGNIFSDKSIGTNNLIKSGAKLTLSAQDVLEELNLQSKTQKIKAQKILPDTKEEAEILKHLRQDDPTHIDQLVLKSGLDIAKVNSTLILMEMKGKIRNLGANQYVIS